MGYFYILGTILFTVYGQLILKWRMNAIGLLPEPTLEKILFLVKLVFDPYIFSGFVAAFVASIFWIAAMTKFDVSYAYPFMSGAFILVFIFSVFLFHEPVSWYKVMGLVLIVAGIVVTSRSI